MSNLDESSFQAPFWARNRHVQTIWPRFFQRRKLLKIENERLELPDGDFVDLAWTEEPRSAKGLVILFHGLEGSVRSHYANDLMAFLLGHGWQTVLMHFRGCSGENNRLARSYHSGETSDPSYFLEQICARHPDRVRHAIGFSLGGNMLLKLLGENPQQTWVEKAVSVSAPLNLAECSDSINQGFSRVYQRYLLNSMIQTLQEKMRKISYEDLVKVGHHDLHRLTNFRVFDDLVTAPLHGYKDSNDYYSRCSAIHYLKNIETPTLVLHAKDDPFMNEKVLPKAHQLAQSVRVELSDKGGHVGFMYGSPWRPKIWFQKRILEFLEDH